MCSSEQDTDNRRELRHKYRKDLKAHSNSLEDDFSQMKTSGWKLQIHELSVD